MSSVERGNNNSVLVFGETLVDEFPDRVALGGAPFNVAFHLRRFGLAPVLITRLGDDEEGRALLEAMRAAGLNAHGVQSDELLPTGRVRVEMIDGGGHRFRILPTQAYDYVDPIDAEAAATSVAPEFVYFGTLAQRCPRSQSALAAVLEVAECPRFLDINLREPWYDLETIARSLTVADVVKMNDLELETVAHLVGVEGVTAEHKARALLERFHIPTMVVTCGKDGAYALDREGAQSRIEGRPFEGAFADSVGAGDGFAAVFIVGLLRGWTVPVVLERADAFARAMCGVNGAIPPESLYEPFLANWGLAT